LSCHKNNQSFNKKIDVKKLRKLVKEKNIQSNFYNVFEDDKIVEALNTIAFNDNLPIQNTAQRGKTIPFKDLENPLVNTKSLIEQYVPIEEEKQNFLNIKDPRKILATSQQPIRPNSDNVSGRYNTYHLDKLINEAVKSGLPKDDIMNLVAMGFQETKWGRADDNIGHVIGDFGGDNDYSNYIKA
jgi:hypothetical protein